MKKTVLLLCWMFLKAAAVFAQTPNSYISGTVVDSQYQPVAGVAVILQTEDSVYVDSTVTDIDGCFTFKSSVRPYILLFRHVSYELYGTTDLRDELGQIVLVENQNVIDEVVVSAQKPLVKVDDGKLVYDTSSLLSGRVANSAYDVVRQVPGVVEENDNITLSGAGRLTVILNGKPSTLSAEQLSDLLKTMPAGRVAKVEVMYSAPPQYHVRGAAINVVLKNSLYNIVSGELFGQYYSRYFNSWRGGADIVFSTTKLSGDFMYSYSDSKTLTNIDMISHHLFNNEIYDIRQMQQITNSNLSHNIRAGLDYNINPDNVLRFTYTSAVFPRIFSTTSAAGNFVNSSSTLSGDNTIHNIALNYSRKERMTVGVDYTDYRMSHDQVMTNSQHVLISDFVSLSSQKINKIKTYFDHSMALPEGWNMGYGASFDFARSRDSQEYFSENDDMAENNVFSTLDEYTYDVYAGVDKNFESGISLSAYLTGEYYRRNSYDRWALLPQLSLTYMAAPDHIVQLSASSDKVYPSYWQMQESVSHIDGYAQVRGNAGLMPMYSYQAVAMYMLKQKYILQLFCIYTRNYFQQSVFQSPESLALLYQTLNWNYSRDCGFNIVVPFKVGRFWDSHLTLAGFDSRIKNDDFNGMTVDNHKWVWRLMMSNSFTLSSNPAISLELSGYFQSPAVQCTYDIEPVWAVNAGLKCSFLKDKLSLSIMCNDIFESAVPRAIVNMPPQNLEIFTGAYSRTLTVRLSYKIGGYKQRPHENVDTSRFGH